MSDTPEALRLAEIFSSGQYSNGTAIQAAAELRRQHAELVSMRAERRHTESELFSAKGEIERMREAALGVLDAMEVVRSAKQSEGAGGGSWISRPATREHQVRMQKAYADMHKAEAVLCNALQEPK